MTLPSAAFACLAAAPWTCATSGMVDGFAALPVAMQFGLAIVVGLVVGSFVTVVTHRLPIMLERAWREDVADIVETRGTAVQPVPDDGLPARYNLWFPRSACPRCGHALRAWENIPVLSYLLLRGRCAACHARISPRYPLTELASAVLAVLSLHLSGPAPAALAAFGLAVSLLALSIIDIDTQLLPDSLTLLLLWAGLLVNLGAGFAPLRDAVLGAVAGYFVLWCVHWAFRLIRGINGMGPGDLKLLAALGAWLGWAALPQILLVAAASGALLGLGATWLGKMRFDEPLPFGPFLATGGIITLFAGNALCFGPGA